MSPRAQTQALPPESVDPAGIGRSAGETGRSAASEPKPLWSPQGIAPLKETVQPQASKLPAWACLRRMLRRAGLWLEHQPPFSALVFII